MHVAQYNHYSHDGKLYTTCINMHQHAIHCRITKVYNVCYTEVATCMHVGILVPWLLMLKMHHPVKWSGFRGSVLVQYDLLDLHFLQQSEPRRHVAMPKLPRIRWVSNGPTGVQLGLQLPTVDMYRYVSPNLPEHVKLTYVVPKAINLIKALNCDWFNI